MRPVQNSFHFAHAPPPAVFLVARVFPSATCIPVSDRSAMGPRSTRLKVAKRRVKLSFMSVVLRKIEMRRLSSSGMRFGRSALYFY